MRIFSQLRNRLEGLAFSIDPIACNAPGRWREMRRRGGLAAFRKGWWIQTRFESYAALLRYARLLDWALGEPECRWINEPLPREGRVLVFRFGHLGDMLHLLPVVDSIKYQRPDIRLELVTGPWNKPLASQFGAFDAVHYFTPAVVQFHRGERDGVLSSGDEREWIRRLRGDGVDSVFAPAPPHFCELPIMVGVQAAWYVGAEWPSADVPIAGGKRFLPFDSRRYELDTVANFLPLMGLHQEPLHLRYRIPEAAAARARDVIRETGLSERPFIAAFPGAGWPGKCWPAEKFAAALDEVSRETGIAVVLGGNSAERSLCEQVRSGMKQTAINTAGLMSLDESAALIERAAAVLCNDSAPLHIAAALDRPTVSLWGPTYPEKWAPRGAKHRVIRADGACAGCIYWHPRARCEGRPPCMETIEVETVVRALLDALEWGSAEGKSVPPSKNLNSSVCAER